MSTLSTKKKCYLALAAPSGGGKTTIARFLIEKYKNLKIAISHTTRVPRRGEKNGKEYFFTTEKKFKQMIDDGNFVEWATVHDDYYGTSKEAIESEQGKIIVFDIDVQGVASLKKIFHEKVLSIFLLPPSIETLKKRLTTRGFDSLEKIKKRLSLAEKEISFAQKFDYKIVNNNLEETLQQVCSILEKNTDAQLK